MTFNATNTRTVAHTSSKIHLLADPVAVADNLRLHFPLDPAMQNTVYVAIDALADLHRSCVGIEIVVRVAVDGLRAPAVCVLFAIATVARYGMAYIVTFIVALRGVSPDLARYTETTARREERSGHWDLFLIIVGRHALTESSVITMHKNHSTRM